MEFDKVGRLQPIQSTRGFGLSGQPYTFQPPIKPKPKKRKKRRAKAGKIVYDNTRARYFRQIEMGQRRRRRLHRNTTDAGRNPYSHIGEEEGLVRPDANRDIVIRVEQQLDRRLDREVEEIEDIVQRRIGGHRGNIRVPNEVPVLHDRGIVRLPRVEAGVNPEEREGVINLEAPTPPDPRIEEVSSSEKSLSQLSIDDPKLLEEVEPTRERQDTSGRSLRDVPIVSYAESSQSSEQDDPNFDPNEPTKRKKKGAGAVKVEESDFLEEQLKLEREAEERRLLQIRRDKEALAKRDKAESESFRLERGGSSGSVGFDISGDVNGVPTYEREVNREDDSDADKRGFLRRGVEKVKRGLSRVKVEEEPIAFSTPFPQKDIVGGGRGIDNPMLGVGGVIGLNVVSNPLDDATTEASSEITTDRLERVLSGERLTDIDQQTTIPDTNPDFELD